MVKVITSYGIRNPDVSDVNTTKAHYQCPSCGVDMNIAARYDKSDRNVEGVAKNNLHQCHKCDKIVAPVVKNV